MKPGEPLRLGLWEMGRRVRWIEKDEAQQIEEFRNLVN